MALLITVFFIFLLCVTTYSLPIFITFWRGTEQIGIKKKKILPSTSQSGKTGDEQFLFSSTFVTKAF